MTTRRRPVPSADARWSRRSVVEWLGKATVAAIGAELVAACGGADAVVAAACADQEFDFMPSVEDPDQYEGWHVRLVDPQEVADLLADWQLTVDGLVDRPMELSFADVISLPRQNQVTDFHCVEGWSVLDVPWSGVHLSSIIDRVSPRPAATHVTFESFGGIYTESLPLEVALEPRTLLGYGVACRTLPLRHGFPLRIVVPRKFGYKNAKTVERIEFTDRPVRGYWVERGYPYDADVQPERLRPGKY